MIKRVIHAWTIVLVGAIATGAVYAQPIKVELVKQGDGWQLQRGGKPYYVHGAGGDASKVLLRDIGGNSFRTWGVGDETQKQLDEAHKLGLTVTLGIWLGHERHGFNYNDFDAVDKQFEQAKAAVLKYKDHPALLMWSVGNEMEGDGNNPAIWAAVQQIAAMIKEVDPNHPTMTVTADIGGNKVRAIHRMCPAIDIIGINSYGGGPSIPQRYREQNGTKPYMITEFGPPGVWEIGRNSWGAVHEMTSTEKAQWYRNTATAVANDKQLGLGYYAFAWGSKQEATATWYGMVLPDGTLTESVHVMASLWGKPLANRAPRIAKLEAVTSAQVKPGEAITARVEATDPDGDELKIEWLLADETGNYNTGGDYQAAPPTYPDALAPSRDGTEVVVTMPQGGGGYRLFAFVRDGRNNAATANLPLFVDGAKAAPAPGPGRNANLPLVLVGDDSKAPFVPSGYMGDYAAIKMDERSVDAPHAGSHCTRVDFTKNDGWGGVVWQHPHNDWGDAPGGYDLTGATKLTFWARGADGGEKVKFGYGLIDRDKPFYDTAKGEIEIALTKDWKQYEISLVGRDLKRIKSGFYWTLGGQGKPLTFFLDDVRYE